MTHRFSFIVADPGSGRTGSADRRVIRSRCVQGGRTKEKTRAGHVALLLLLTLLLTPLQREASESQIRTLPSGQSANQIGRFQWDRQPQAQALQRLPVLDCLCYPCYAFQIGHLR